MQDAAFEGTVLSPSGHSGCPGVQCCPGIPGHVLSHSLLEQMWFFTSGSNFVFRLFWAEWRKITSLSVRGARTPSLQAFQQPCFLPCGDVLSAPIPTPRALGQALRAHLGLAVSSNWAVHCHRTVLIHDVCCQADPRGSCCRHVNVLLPLQRGSKLPGQVFISISPRCFHLCAIKLLIYRGKNSSRQVY